MDSIPLAIRLADPQQTKDGPSSPKAPDDGEEASASRAIATSSGSLVNHQFWLNDIKIVESLYTVGRGTLFAPSFFPSHRTNEWTGIPELQTSLELYV
jgi:hypothetical protein